MHSTNAALGYTIVPSALLSSINRFIVRNFALFGVEYHQHLYSVNGAVNISSSSSSSSSSGSHYGGSSGGGGDTDAINQFVSFRSTVRNAALQDPKSPVAQVILQACDVARNETFTGLGIEVTDRRGSESTWRIKS
eukprot:TRINITY_DN602_c1_g1_i1.p1 TRINITY_DN602_c1_g1~~TRINITY_DN602_c1_g1_i1.p1  ORF type:complete len:136 (-),score=25.25 TRINITY_DN602_c1_g1_i1:258-665(-)